MGFLAMNPTDARRMIHVGLRARDIFAAIDPELELPIGLLRALCRIHSRRHWARFATESLLELVACRRISATQAKKAARAARNRAHWSKLPRGRRRARWWVQARDGSRIQVIGSNVIG